MIAVERIRSEMRADPRVRAAIKRTVDAAPAFTSDQKATLAILLAPAVAEMKRRKQEQGRAAA